MTPDYRPVFHFAPPRGWMNDPNGLVWHQGWWHLFYQYQPDELQWGPMHWGHAVSRDLTRWEDWPLALAPDELGQIFSGSAARCSPALCPAAQGAELVACFTHARRGAQVQSLAFSRDAGRTWQKYAGNPVLGGEAGERADFRDPKIFRWGQSWRMVVAAGERAEIYGSPDLTSWTRLSDFAAPHAGWTWECPDLFPLGESWVLLGSFVQTGASPAQVFGSFYWIGDFDGQRFVPHGEGQLLSFGPDDYAAVSWNDAPDARRLIIGWMSRWTYAADTPTAHQGWRGAQTLPRELRLENGVLRQNPPSEIAARRGLGTPLSSRIENAGIAFEIEAEIDLMHLRDEKTGFRVRVGASEATEVSFDARRHELCLDRTRSGQVGFHPDFSGVFRAPLPLAENRLQLRIFVDGCSVEVFAQNGALYGAALIFPSPASRAIEFFGEGAKVNGKCYSYTR